MSLLGDTDIVSKATSANIPSHNKNGYYEMRNTRRKHNLIVKTEIVEPKYIISCGYKLSNKLPFLYFPYAYSAAIPLA